MNAALVDKIVSAVLYEGYMLYPYRRSSLKNQHRWNFGLVYPEGMEPSCMTTECLVQGDGETAIAVEVRFLQLYEQGGEQEAVERRVALAEAGAHAFQFENLQVQVHIAREDMRPGLQKLRVDIRNNTPLDQGCNHLLQSLISTHTILSSQSGRFISLLDPPDDCRELAAGCRNAGTWPVLVGRPPEQDCVLSSPIILYDYPSIADESPGDLFDATEIDEILTLRILALSDAEKEEVRRSGERERRLLERAESLTSEQLLKLHGTMRDIRSGLKPGDRVVLRPKPGGDIFDVVLKGRVAIVEAVEQDFENRVHVAVVIEDDPGKDLGLMRQPGHRFFFSADEVELIA
ncbi:MAG TPA: hypothetical protein VGK48_06730 [Terriglobia bacterium]|jgi:hypothetical protein